MMLFPTKVVEDKGLRRDASAKPQETRAERLAPLIFQINIPGLSGRVGSKVLTHFTRQLATLVQAGLPLLRGLRAIQDQESNANLRHVIADLITSIEEGSTFSDALALHPKVFNRLFINMVKAGEVGGVLEVVLRRLSDFMDKAQKIKGKVVAAMFYPLRRHRGRHRHHGPVDALCHSQVQGGLHRLARSVTGRCPLSPNWSSPSVTPFATIFFSLLWPRWPGSFFSGSS